MELKTELLAFRKWQQENWSNVYLYDNNFMITTYIESIEKVVPVRVVDLESTKPINFSIPTTLDDAVIELRNLITGKQLIRSANGEFDLLSLHHSGGQWIRNNWGLWGGSKLRTIFFGLGLFHADDMSSIIFKKLQSELRNEKFNLKDEVQHYISFWKNQNVDCQAKIKELKNYKDGTSN